MKRKRKTSKGLQVTQVFAFDEESPSLTLPLAVAKISAGFPSPADDYTDERLDLNDLLVKHPAATHFVRVEGDSMIDAGIHSGDILVVDRALEPTDRKVVIAVVDGDLTVKRVRKSGGRLYLAPENQAFKPIEITGEMDFEVWGVVTYVIHAV